MLVILARRLAQAGLVLLLVALISFAIIEIERESVCVLRQIGHSRAYVPKVG